MNPFLLEALARERRHEIGVEFARGGRSRRKLRRALARLLRACGDRLFRLGVALDDARVPCAAGVKSPHA